MQAIFVPVPLRPRDLSSLKSDVFQVDCRGLSALGIALFFEFDLLTLRQADQTGTLNGRDVDEDIRATVVRLDESVALGAVEPFDSADRHSLISR